MKNGGALLKERPLTGPGQAREPVGGEAEASTRRRVLASIMEHGPSTAAQLSERLALTPAAVRRHLAHLTGTGELTSREQRVYGARGRGRPAKVFLATDAGRADFFQAYDQLAIDSLEFLRTTAGDEAVLAFARERVSAMERRARDRMPQDSPDKLVALAEALNADGYMASVSPVTTGEQLCQHHCPVAHVAERFPELCAAETEAFSRLVGSHVQRLATIAHGDGVCTTHVPTAVQPDDTTDPTKGNPR